MHSAFDFEAVFASVLELMLPQPAANLQSHVHLSCVILIMPAFSVSFNHEMLALCTHYSDWKSIRHSTSQTTIFSFSDHRKVFHSPQARWEFFSLKILRCESDSGVPDSDSKGESAK